MPLRRACSSIDGAVIRRHRYVVRPVRRMPLGVDPYAGPGEEPQWVLGFPAGWYGPVDRDLLRPLRHPIKAYKRWALRRPRVLSYLKKVTQSRRADPIP